MRASSFLLLVACAVPLSCGHGSPPVPCPTAAGATGPGDGMSVHVCAVDARTGAPLYGVTLEIDWPTGTESAFDVGPEGAQLAMHGAASATAITASATGYVTASFAGFDASAMTIPLEPASSTSETVTIDVSGLDALATTGATGVEVYLDVSAPASMAALPDEAIAAAAGPASRGPSCRLGPGTATCSAMLQATDGMRSVVATVLTVDDRGTPDPSDDVRTPVGFAVARGVDARGGHLALPVAPATAASLVVDFGTPPGGVGEVVGVPGLASTSEGVAFFASSATPSATTVLAPLDAPALGDAGFWLLGAAASPHVGSIVIARGLHGAGPVSLSGWLVPPTRPSGTDHASLYVADTIDDFGLPLARTYAPTAAAITVSHPGRLVAITAPAASASGFVLADVDARATAVSYASL